MQPRLPQHSPHACPNLPSAQPQGGFPPTSPASCGGTGRRSFSRTSLIVSPPSKLERERRLHGMRLGGTHCLHFSWRGCAKSTHRRAVPETSVGVTASERVRIESKVVAHVRVPVRRFVSSGRGARAHLDAVRPEQLRESEIGVPEAITRTDVEPDRQSRVCASPCESRNVVASEVLGVVEGTRRSSASVLQSAAECPPTAQRLCGFVSARKSAR